MYVRPDSKVVPATEWRWNRIVSLCHRENAQPTPPDDDVYILTGWNFLREFHAADGREEQEAVVSRRYPELYEAYTLKVMGASITRAAIESMLVANVSPEAIAEQYDMHADVVSWYQHLWFDLRDKAPTRLQVTTVMTPDVHTAIDEINHDAYFKLLGASFPNDVLLNCLELKQSTDGDLDVHSRVIHSLQQFKTMRAVAATQINRYTAPTVIGLHTQMEQQIQDAKTANAASGNTAAKGYLVEGLAKFGSGFRVATDPPVRNSLQPARPVRGLIEDAKTKEIVRE